MPGRAAVKLRWIERALPLACCLVTESAFHLSMRNRPRSCVSACDSCSKRERIAEVSPAGWFVGTAFCAGEEGAATECAAELRSVSRMMRFTACTCLRSNIVLQMDDQELCRRGRQIRKWRVCALAHTTTLIRLKTS